MTGSTFTPKQVAQALGVSESSVKRWVDNGKLRAAKTAGGHRKVPLESLATFIRETGHPLAEPSVVGMLPSTRGAKLETCHDELYAALIAGQESACREMVLGFYQQGASVAELGDRLIGPVLRRIGDGWEARTVQVYEERRSCEVMMATLHELRRWLPPAPPEAPLAAVATPLRDFAEVPIRLLELTLVACGWRVTVFGSGLPLEEIYDAVASRQPALLCLSVTHLEDPEAFPAQINARLARPLKSAKPPVALAIGGGALCGDASTKIECDLVAAGLADLVSFQKKLNTAK